MGPREGETDLGMILKCLPLPHRPTPKCRLKRKWNKTLLALFWRNKNVSLSRNVLKVFRKPCFTLCLWLVQRTFLAQSLFQLRCAFSVPTSLCGVWSRHSSAVTEDLPLNHWHYYVLSVPGVFLPRKTKVANVIFNFINFSESHSEAWNWPIWRQRRSRKCFLLRVLKLFILSHWNSHLTLGSGGICQYEL